MAWPDASACPAKVNIASVMAMSRWQPCPVWSRWRRPSRMLITAGSVPPPMSAISAGGTTGRSGGPGIERQQSGVADVVEIVAGLARRAGPVWP